MTRTVRVLFDGEMLRPKAPLDLKPNEHYRVIIEEEPEAEGPDRRPGVLDDIAALAQDLDLPSDYAAQLHHYVHGTPKQ